MKRAGLKRAGVRQAERGGRRVGLSRPPCRGGARSGGDRTDGRWREAPLLHRRERRRRQDEVLHVGDDRAVASSVLARAAMPVRIGAERVPLLLAIRQRFPCERGSTASGSTRRSRVVQKPACLMPCFSHSFSVIVSKRLLQVGQPARDAFIDPQFVEHGFLSLGDDVGLRLEVCADAPGRAMSRGVAAAGGGW